MTIKLKINDTEFCGTAGYLKNGDVIEVKEMEGFTGTGYIDDNGYVFEKSMIECAAISLV